MIEDRAARFRVPAMTDRLDSLQTSIATIVKALKVTEPSVQTAHGELKLAPSDLQALAFIGDNPDCMSSAMAADLGVAATTATSIVDRMVGRGFVDRSRPEDNRRVVSLRLTPEGRDALDRLQAENRQKSAFMLSLMSESEQQVFVEVMARVADAFSKRR